MKNSYHLVILGILSLVQVAGAFVNGFMYYKSLLVLAVPLPCKDLDSPKRNHKTTFSVRGTSLHYSKHNDDDINKKNGPENFKPERNFFIDDECYDLCEEEGNGIFDTIASPKPKNRDVLGKTEKSLEHSYKTLELQWGIEEAKDKCDPENPLSCSEPCDLCRGTGVISCHFCQGTGYINFGEQAPGTVGERLVERNGGHSGAECPVCNEDGEVTCPKCRGSGWIANWRLENETGGLRP
jgi:hypothetical protein